MEKLILIGNLGQDPEMKYTPAGQSVVTFSVASNRRYKGSDGEASFQESTYSANRENHQLPGSAYVRSAGTVLASTSWS